jgi:hypothetical protein
MLTGMAVIAICAALVVVGIGVVVRWGGGAPMPSADAAAARSPLVGLARYAGVMAAVGVVAGLLAAGAGGRLAMRLLALTSSGMHRTLTEGGATIGEITIAGTISFVTFVGVTSGLLSGALFALIRPLLPRGRAGGLALGAILLVLAGSRIEPLRSDNVDFALVGPDWLSVLLFAVLALFQGMLVVALAARLSGSAPSWRPGTGARRAVVVGQVATAVVVLAALPGFVSAIADILTSA